MIGVAKALVISKGHYFHLLKSASILDLGGFILNKNLITNLIETATKASVTKLSYLIRTLVLNKPTLMLNFLNRLV